MSHTNILLAKLCSNEDFWWEFKRNPERCFKQLGIPRNKWEKLAELDIDEIGNFAGGLIIKRFTPLRKNMIMTVSHISKKELIGIFKKIHKDKPIKPYEFPMYHTDMLYFLDEIKGLRNYPNILVDVANYEIYRYELFSALHPKNNIIEKFELNVNIPKIEFTLNKDIRLFKANYQLQDIIKFGNKRKTLDEIKPLEKNYLMFFKDNNLKVMETTRQMLFLIKYLQENDANFNELKHFLIQKNINVQDEKLTFVLDKLTKLGVLKIVRNQNNV